MEQATEFALDVQQKMQESGVCMKDTDALREILQYTLQKYPDAVVASTIKFKDGSEAVLTTHGFITKKDEPASKGKEM